MATRRARIKGVATLPVRRKNTESISATKSKALIEENKEANPKDDIIETSEKSSEQTNGNVESLKTVDIVTNGFKNPNIAPPQLDGQSQNQNSVKILSNKLIKLPTNLNSNKLKSPIKTDANANNLNQSEFISIPDLEKNTVSKSPKNIFSIDGIQKLDPKSPLKDTSDKSTISRPHKSPLDGIVPLNSAVHLDDSRNLNFEVAEVSFDPIVPLPVPSPGKLRPKLKPVPRLGHVRRNSVQGSASESEDDSRRQHCATPVTVTGQAPSTPCPPSAERTRHDSASTTVINRESQRVRNDSICSTMSVGGQSAFMSPLKEKHLLSRTKRSENRFRFNNIRRRLRRGVSRDSMTMYDLIFCNPTTNPLVKEESTSTDKKTNKSEPKDEEVAQSTEDQDGGEESVDDPGAEDEPAPAVQIKLAADGSIVVDEASTIISTTEMKTRKLSDTVVHETEYTGSGGGRYTRGPRSAEWSDAETVRFYRALAVVGTDFSMMLGLFPNRQRKDIKIKFKKEERTNGALVDKALTSKAQYNIEDLLRSFADERRIEKEQKEEEERMRKEAEEETEKKKRIRKAGVKTSAASRAMIAMLPKSKPVKDNLTANDLLEDYQIREEERKSKKKKKITKEKEASAMPHSLISKKVEPGSLVVLSIGSSANPNKKMLQTYVAGADGKLTPVALPNSFLNPVMNYMSHNKSAGIASQSTSPFVSPPSSDRSVNASTPNNMATTPVIGQGIIGSPKILTNGSISLPFNQNSPKVNNGVFLQPKIVDKRKIQPQSPGNGMSPIALEGFIKPMVANAVTPPSAKRRRNNSFTITQLT